ncbi:MAG TPA: hypothetical protein VFG76_03110 [Candidatus Polarisedimenticolia bacterium]|nr:hypothetical protein [Candidatus Polarisedimenticolia bacterium]
MRVLTGKGKYGRPAAGHFAIGLLSIVAALAVATPALALDWTNVMCTPGLECNQTGTPSSPCECGFWKDSPASFTEGVFIFVESADPAADETGKWIATIDPVEIGSFNQLRIRAAANDSSILKVIAYSAVGGNLESCGEVGVDIAGTVQIGPGDDVSAFYTRTAPLNGPVAGLCIILTDDLDSAAPVSGRSSAIIDMIQLRNSSTKKMIALDQFNPAQ